MSVEVEIVLPPRDEDEISDGLRRITKALFDSNPDEFDGGYGLGGEHGYGENYENDVFMMHRFCWCDRDSCPWCGDEQAPNFRHKPTGFEVRWYKWIGRDNELSGNADWPNIEAECLASIKGMPPAGT